MPYNSPGILVFWCQRSHSKSNRSPSMGGPNASG